jgi:hypothetical protein
MLCETIQQTNGALLKQNTVQRREEPERFNVAHLSILTSQQFNIKRNESIPERKVTASLKITISHKMRLFLNLIVTKRSIVSLSARFGANVTINLSILEFINLILKIIIEALA